MEGQETLEGELNDFLLKFYMKRLKKKKKLSWVLLFGCNIQNKKVSLKVQSWNFFFVNI